MNKIVNLLGIQPGNIHIGTLALLLNVLQCCNDNNFQYCYKNKNIIHNQNNNSYNILYIADLNRPTKQTFSTYNIHNIIQIYRKILGNKWSIIMQSDLQNQLLPIVWKMSNICKISTVNKILKHHSNYYKNENLNHNNNDNSDSVGLLIYPLLMATDILLLKPLNIFVGIDQKINIEFSKYILKKIMIRNPNVNFLNLQINSLTSPTRKMSKSAKGALDISDNKEIIKKKILKAVTCSEKPMTLNDMENNIHIKNLINCIYVINSINNILSNNNNIKLNINKLYLQYLNTDFYIIKNDLITVILKLKKILKNIELSDHHYFLKTCYKDISHIIYDNYKNIDKKISTIF